MLLALQILKLVIGGWLVASPWLLGFEKNQPAAISNIILGALLFGMAVVNLVRLARGRALFGVRPKNVGN